jgi:hypothetical protein
MSWGSTKGAHPSLKMYPDPDAKIKDDVGGKKSGAGGEGRLRFPHAPRHEMFGYGIHFHLYCTYQAHVCHSCGAHTSQTSDARVDDVS